MKASLKILKEERFLIPIKIVAVYLAWKVFHYIVHMANTAQTAWWESFCASVGYGYAVVTATVLSIGGMDTTVTGININLLTSAKQILVQEHCLAIPAMVVFTGSILFFRGSWKQKLRFIIIGLIGIALINVVRLTFVCLAWVYLDHYFFNLHHSVIYAVLSYGFIFLMIRWWIRKAEPVAPSTSI